MIKIKLIRYIPTILLVLAILDLRTEFIILIDHVTITSIMYMIKHHFLAISILLFSPSLFRIYKYS